MHDLLYSIVIKLPLANTTVTPSNVTQIVVMIYLLLVSTILLINLSGIEGFHWPLVFGGRKVIRQEVKLTWVSVSNLTQQVH